MNWGRILRRNIVSRSAIDWDDALITASRYGNLNQAKEAILNDANIHVDDDCALRWASTNGHLEIVKHLVENGANVHACDDYALVFASYDSHLEVVKYLLSLENISYWLTSSDKEVRRLAKEYIIGRLED